jgi:hypothetical protein
MQTFALPPAIAQLVLARNAVRDHYRRILIREGSDVDLAFTLDGNLIGDIGEAIAVELFGVKLVAARSNQGIDGHAPDGRSVQVKVTGTRRGPAFRCSETKADHLLFLDLNVETATGTVMFNGPEHLVTKYLPEFFANQRMVTRRQIIDADRLVSPADRLPILTGAISRNPADLLPPSSSPE